MSKINKSIYIKFYSYIPKPIKARILKLIPLLGVAGILEVASLAALIPLLNAILEPGGSNDAGDILKIFHLTEFEKIGFLFTVFFVLMVVKGVFIFFVSRFTYSTALLTKASIQKTLFSWYLGKEYISHQDSNTANYIRNITTECHQIEGRFIMPFLTLIAELLPVMFICIFLLYINPQGILLAGSVLLVSGFLVARFTSTHLKQYGKNQLISDGLQIQVAKEAFAALKEISLYKRQNKLSSIYNKYVNESIHLIGKALALGLVPRFILEIMGLVSIAIIASINFYNGATANQVIIELTIFMAAIVKLLPSSNRIVMNIQSLSHARPAIENILRELENEGENKVGYDESNETIEKIENVSFANVSFKYKTRNEFIYKNVNFKIEVGQVIGFMGETGSGKSTLIDLFLGFTKPVTGEVCVNGVDIQQLINSWQRKIGYVPQDVVLFDDSLKNNILFYDDSIDVNRLDEILDDLELSDLVKSLPEGINTRIGEDGSYLSGGQKQRVGIARALIRKPTIIIFDEATSSLDIETEKSINNTIQKLKLDSIVIVIAHKRSALEVCDKIYKIKDKTIFENESTW